MPLILVLVRQELSVSLGPAWSVYRVSYSTVRANQKKGKGGCGVSCPLLGWNFSSRPGCVTSMLQGHTALVTAPRVMLPFLHGFEGVDMGPPLILYWLSFPPSLKVVSLSSAFHYDNILYDRSFISYKLHIYGINLHIKTFYINYICIYELYMFIYAYIHIHILFMIRNSSVFCTLPLCNC